VLCQFFNRFIVFNIAYRLFTMNRNFVCTVILLLSIALKTHGQTVALDTYYNHEIRKTKNGFERFHYLWTDDKDTGFSKWGSIFSTAGFKLDTVGEKPTLSSLKNADVYIIVDPDTKKEAANPNHITDDAAKQIALWVKAGGVLVMMANDSTNVNLPDFNLLANKFGLHFNNDMPNHVIDDKHFADGRASYVDPVIFSSKQNMFLKDVCSISLNNPAAKGVIKSADGKVVIAATVGYGKGAVFAVGDPWLYNEYLNGRLPAIYQNDVAAAELTSWLKKQITRTNK
jgi:hypothetical protein